MLARETDPKPLTRHVQSPETRNPLLDLYVSMSIFRQRPTMPKGSKTRRSTRNISFFIRSIYISYQYLLKLIALVGIAGARPAIRTGILLLLASTTARERQCGAPPQILEAQTLKRSKSNPRDQNQSPKPPSSSYPKSSEAPFATLESTARHLKPKGKLAPQKRKPHQEHPKLSPPPACRL